MNRNVPAPGVIEGQTLTRDARFEADVCIVGSGAGGAVAAAVLQAAGHKVIVLEEGGYFTSQRFRAVEDEAFSHLYQEGALRATKDMSIAILQGKAVGGTTVVNWTTSFRTPEHVLECWQSRHGVRSVDAKVLTPHFDAVERRLNITKIPLEAANPNNRLLYDGCMALGYSADTIPRNVRNCLHSGYCGLGCPYDAKQSMLVTYLPDAMQAGATVVSRCRVETLDHKDGRVELVRGACLDATGRYATGVRVEVKAKRYILSAGAIGTPGLLLRSGILDANGCTGRRTFLHPVVVSLAEYAEPVRAFTGAPQSIASHHFAERGEEVGFLLEAVPIYPGLIAAAVPGLGLQHEAIMRRLSNLAVHLALTGDGLHEDVPGGTVSICKDGTPVLDYPIPARIWRAFREAQKIMARIQLVTGARRVVTTHDPALVIESERDIAKIDSMPYAPGRIAVFSAHVMGGAAMGSDPAQSVVRDDDFRHHQVENLHVVDGSVFPTGLGVNPQLTIYGLAHLAATRIAQTWS